MRLNSVNDRQMREERQIEKQLTDRLGRQHPFRVPEGYFETFADRLMQQLPQRKTVAQFPARKRHIALWAASICAVAFSIGAYLYFQNPRNTDEGGLLSVRKSAFSVAGGTEENSSLDQAADYMMCNDQDFYAFVLDNE